MTTQTTVSTDRQFPTVARHSVTDGTGQAIIVFDVVETGDAVWYRGDDADGEPIEKNGFKVLWRSDWLGGWIEDQLRFPTPGKAVKRGQELQDMIEGLIERSKQ